MKLLNRCEIDKPKYVYNLHIKNDHNYIANGAVVSNCHLAKADSITNITTLCCNAHMKVGVTGTLDDTKLNRLILQGLFGSICKVSSAADLMEQKILAQLTVKCITLKYDEDECKPVRKMGYPQELDYIVDLKKRNNFIANLCSSINGNKLILVNRIEHGKNIVEALERAYNGPVRFIHGSIKPEVRTQIRKECEASDNMVVVATYGTFQLGINVVNLDHVIFGSPSKSKTQVLQSIGRCLRRGGDKVESVAYDLIDNFMGTRKRQNYLLKHFFERYKYYCEEKFNVVSYEVSF